MELKVRRDHVLEFRQEQRETKQKPGREHQKRAKRSVVHPSGAKEPLAEIGEVHQAERAPYSLWRLIAGD